MFFLHLKTWPTEKKGMVQSEDLIVGLDKQHVMVIPGENTIVNAFNCICYNEVLNFYPIISNIVHL